MKLYLAAVYTNRLSLTGSYFARMQEVEKKDRLAVRYILESYHYVSGNQYVADMRADGAKVFLDSGAFSAFTKGVSVDLDAYCRYVRDNADIIECASVLDSVGDALKTFQNQDAMESLGIKPLPCFHYGEDERYLEYYIERYEYITLGGMVPVASPQLKLWLDRIWSKYLCGPDGRPKVKVHGFGMTRIQFAFMYPWYSVDSSSWVAYANNGKIFIPSIGVIEISNGKSTVKEEGMHFNNYNTAAQTAIARHIEGRGYTVKSLQENYVSRWAFNIGIYNEIAESVLNKEKIFQLEQIPLFS